MKEEKEEVLQQEVDAAAEEQAKKDAEMQAEVDDGPGKIFEFADVHFHCNQCDNDTKIAEGLRGVSFTVGAAEKAEVKFECTKCGNVLKMYFLESSEEVKEARRKQVAEEEKAYKEAIKQQVEDGADQENTEVEPGQGSSNDTERSAETDKEGDGSSVSTDATGQGVEA